MMKHAPTEHLKTEQTGFLTETLTLLMQHFVVWVQEMRDGGAAGGEITGTFN